MFSFFGGGKLGVTLFDYFFEIGNGLLDGPVKEGSGGIVVSTTVKILAGQ
jgi:hypothetical protein